MTDVEARRLLRDWPGAGEVAWIAQQQWQAAPGGWTVNGELQGWRFQIEIAAEGLRVSASMPGALPAVWLVRA
jgi:hypothetical protein